jgi:site-specific recombinase XerC
MLAGRVRRDWLAFVWDEGGGVTGGGDPVTMPAVVTLGHAVDYYVAHLAREGRRKATRNSYRRLLTDFARSCHDKAPAELELADYDRFLNRWTDSSPSTLASNVSLVKGFSRFLYDRGLAAVDVAAPLKRPRRQRPEPRRRHRHRRGRAQDDPRLRGLAGTAVRDDRRLPRPEPRRAGTGPPL